MAVFSFGFDRERGAAVLLMSGPHNSDDDFTRYLLATTDMKSTAARHDLAVAVLVVDAGNPPPNARWRRQIAEATSDTPANVLFVLVSTSALIRGAVTAIEWIRPSRYQVRTCGAFDEAVQIAAGQRPDLATLLPRLMQEARHLAHRAP